MVVKDLTVTQTLIRKKKDSITFNEQSASTALYLGVNTDKSAPNVPEPLTEEIHTLSAQ